MTSAIRPVVSAVAVLAAALLMAGCTSSPGATSPTSSSAPQESGTPAPTTGDEVEAAWLDDGRMFAIVTQGSSTCIPAVETVTADGQTVTVALAVTEGEDAACTADFAPRASVGALPEGVDPTEDVEFVVTLDGRTDDVDLDGDAALTGVPGSPTEYAPSAGWLDDGSLVLLTWGSSSCAPVVEAVEGSGATGTVTFTTAEDQVCTMDMAPRATLIAFGDDQVDDDDFQLTLVGANLDATVAVRG